MFTYFFVINTSYIYKVYSTINIDLNIQKLISKTSSHSFGFVEDLLIIIIWWYYARNLSRKHVECDYFSLGTIFFVCCRCWNCSWLFPFKFDNAYFVYQLKRILTSFPLFCNFWWSSDIYLHYCVLWCKYWKKAKTKLRSIKKISRIWKDTFKFF